MTVKRPLSERKKTLLGILRQAGTRGATSLEIEHDRRWNHGSVSGALSNMDADGLVDRLRWRRGTHSVYVLPGNDGGVAIIPRRRNAPCPHCGKRPFLEETQGSLWND